MIGRDKSPSRWGAARWPLLPLLEPEADAVERVMNVRGIEQHQRQVGVIHEEGMDQPGWLVKSQRIASPSVPSLRLLPKAGTTQNCWPWSKLAL